MARLRLQLLLRWSVVICCAMPGAGALANTITFQTPPSGTLSGSTTEDGFTYSTLSGGLVRYILGNPGQDMEGEIAVNGGTLKIVSAGGGDFIFHAVDAQAAASGNLSLTLMGVRGGSSVGTDTYVVAPGPYITEAASTLAGQTLSELDIVLVAQGPLGDPHEYTMRIDNVVLTSVPEPATLTILGLALGAIGLAKRRKLN